jgi:hypothetical protein
MIRDRAYDEALYAYRGCWRRDIRSINSGVWRKAEDEEERVNEDKNTPKDHDILPKDPSEVDI